MAQSKNGFVNEKELPILIGDMEGTFVIPKMLTEEDLSGYLENITKAQEEFASRSESEKKGVRLAVQIKIRNVQHIVREIQFPGVTLQQVRKGEIPYPAVSRVLVDGIQPLIDDALNLGNS